MNIKEETVYSNVETANSKQLAILKKHFPNCFDRDGNFIQERMLEIVNDNEVELSKESYSLNWLGKSYSRLLANLPPKTLIRGDVEHNAQDEHKDSKNLLFKGDNLEVLKHLVNAYSEKVKMIYIDPPYNTGKDGFTYIDDRSFTKEQLIELVGMDEDEAIRTLDFIDKGSSSHSAWLTFMYPRLYVARELMSDDGVIFISLDDNELSQLKIICDEIFGESNHLGNVIWKNVTDNNPTNIAVEHEYIVAFAKNKERLEGEWKSGVSDLKDYLLKVEDDLLSEHDDLDALQAEYTNWYRQNKSQLGSLENYKFIDKGGIYAGLRGVHNPGKEGYRYDIIHPVTGKPCKQPLMGYRFPKATMNQMIEDKKIIFGQDDTKLVEIKVYLKDYQEKFSSVINLDGRSGANELRELFPEMKKAFSNPKSTQLLEQLISFSCSNSGIVLDFFAGSGTTANAVAELNHRTGSTYQYISVQLDECNKIDSEPYKNGYKTIFDITKERLKRVSIKTNQGFKVFETVEDFRVEEDDKELTLSNLTMFDDVLLTDEQYQTLLTTWVLYDGSELTTPIYDIDLDGYRAHLCDRRLYMIAPDFSSKALKALLHKLDDTDDRDFDPNKIVYYANNFDSVKQMELNEALKSYANKKSIEIDVVVRN
ncbi:site-specific DNA-methyltransferase [Vibrio parahaemolyticus]|uniref:site-specific DNA-methyltransferase n=1 Tax=Vibrio parahaemolyticus TaxID=670 RepID=UPI00038E30F5|nr:site-specific DNA-methyltransferase [Vibrio parahaemolyticus]MCU8407721.1 site-specific DNA-methyltransferase [Vibrio vulnificus]EGQ7975803.1 site-specific DNA-methyltransferase [Vibrio parahaemolyticus]EQM13560.1 type III restriction-modification system enzyme [Vibrio parahaemolyticus 3259]ETJ85505.1 type III restriction-modification system EcoPI enzyme mod [Vibrio parahaemolyticus EKP-008]MBY4625970.1 site-specific DNA-methyltransferase [Vibrio parahaemolyticus]